MNKVSEKSEELEQKTRKMIKDIALIYADISLENSEKHWKALKLDHFPEDKEFWAEMDEIRNNNRGNEEKQK